MKFAGISIKFEPRAFCVGLCWNRLGCTDRTYLDVYVCPVPFIVLLLEFCNKFEPSQVQS